MKWLKAFSAGILASLLMEVALLFFLKMGLSPVHTPFSAAFLQRLGIVSGPGPLSLTVHLLYGAFCSMLFVHWLGSTRNMNVKSGWIMGTGLWLFMMVFYGPIIGWGFFGFSALNAALPPEDPLYLASASGYIALTFFLHLLYGTILGWLNPVLLGRGAEKPENRIFHREKEEPRLAA